MMPSHDVLIVGGGHAGAHAAASLRANGFTGTLALLSNEPELPYERPPLSKDYLAGHKSFERMLLRPPQFWSERNIELILNQTVLTLDVAARRVHTLDGSEFEYGVLIWAAG